MPSAVIDRKHTGADGSGALAVGSTLGRRPLPRRALLATALLLLVPALALYQALPAGRHSAPAAVRHQAAFSRAGLLSLPRAAQAAVSAALGDSPAYRIRTSAGGFTAANAAQHLSASFTAPGVSVSSGTTRVRLRLLGVGYGARLQPFGPVTPHARANRVTYPHPGLSEWYANGPLGLEQGFTIAHAPAGRAAGPLTLAMALSGNAHASLAKDAQSITLARAGKAALRYTGLSASDARGHVLRSWLSLAAGRIVLHIDASRASYPLRVDPLVQEQELTAGSAGELGQSVALSANGSTAVIGARTEKSGDGAAWVFTRTGATWKEQAELTGGEESAPSLFGSSVALSSSGNTALIGGTQDNGTKGAAWVFTRSGEKWTQQGTKLTGSEESSDAEFGESVALSAEGNIALIGGPRESTGFGAVWAFSRSGEKWIQQGAKLTASGEACEGGEGGGFGWSVALSAEGNTAIIGAPFEEEQIAKDSCGGGEIGSFYEFTRSGEKWTQHGEKVRGSGEAGEGQFGFSVALSAEGSTVLIGAPDDEPALGFGPGVGAAFGFALSGKKWTQQGQKLTGAGESGDTGEFGKSVALSSNGDLALIGGPQDDENLGAAWTFTRSGEAWTQQGEKLTPVGESGNGMFGWSVALDSEGKTAVLGAPHNPANGAAWVFAHGAGVEAEAASEITAAAAHLSASVNPSGEEVTSCKFEYGTSESYGKSEPCSPAPGSGASPVAVSAALSGLSPDTTYHFRVSAASAFGTGYGPDETFTTLATFNTGSTEKEVVPAKASDGELSAEASSGTGAVTVGPYGSDIGGGPLFKGSGKYIDIYRGTSASFKKIEFKDCELGGAKAIWWDNPATGWEPIAEPPAVYTEAPTPCITVTITESTKPDVAQMTGTRFGFAETPGVQEYGKCEAAKDANYSEGACADVAEKKGKPDHKGKYEWYANPVECFPMKDGRYSEGKCLTLDEKKGEPKGKFEKGSSAFTSASHTVKLESKGAGTVECEASTAEGELTGLKSGMETLTYTGCKRESSSCASAGETAGTIRTDPLESITYEADEKYFLGLAGNPIMKFTCGSTALTLSGEVSGETTGDINVMSARSESVFKQGAGYQGLKLEDSNGAFEATLNESSVATSAEAVELATSHNTTD
jgi:hypothetical protein